MLEKIFLNYETEVKVMESGSIAPGIVEIVTNGYVVGYWDKVNGNIEIWTKISRCNFRN